MSQNLTQPEEIDQILWAMVERDLEKLMPIPGGTPPTRASRDAPYEKFAAEPDFSRGVVHRESAQGLPGPQRDVRHMK
jgi:hypothetical protein